MKKSSKIILGSALAYSVLMLVFSICLYVSISNVKKDNTKLKNRVKDLETVNSTMENDINSLKTSKNKMQEDIENLEDQLAADEAIIEDLQTKVDNIIRLISSGS